MFIFGTPIGFRSRQRCNGRKNLVPPDRSARPCNTCVGKSVELVRVAAGLATHRVEAWALLCSVLEHA